MCCFTDVIFRKDDSKTAVTVNASKAVLFSYIIYPSVQRFNITTLKGLASYHYSPFSLLTTIKPEELEGGLTTPIAFLAVTLNS